MTAVDWLIGELIHKGLMALRYDKDNTFNELIGEAKEMEKQQIEKSFRSGYNSCEYENSVGWYDERPYTIDEYYKEIYGSKGSDDIKEETKPHSFCETPEEKCTMSYCDENGCINRKRNLAAEPIENPITSSQTEISDEEILKEPNRMHGVASIGFEDGAKWYREQIKKK